ncbi:Murein DD-endopeptidase MepM and murein hydrolase activator NlpD, contain LysM domain [Oscillibacter sp. PC13]|uniref:peptidoglycan DD-metalloendopeptidase family protein n=1 Tax=Oscillibacter sp. PC13 TaxID=1855299 RepID=UPI0008ECDBD8|nr:M23 family metallopeptidase [Oscillibacter sp. PC13]SFP51012.1 Murein DD-endopeptidase MepM and murein hydrolase activator NlpD, contain LysM domain [Oscillibacter sp. PC13]
MIDEQKKVNNAVRKPQKGGKRLAKSPEELHRRSPAAGDRTTNARIRTPHRDMPVQDMPAAGSDDAARSVRRRETVRPVREAAKPAIDAWAEDISPSHDNAEPDSALRKMRRAAQRWQEADGDTSPLISLYHTLVSKAKRVRRRWRHIVREKRAKNFPESERFPIQFLLFAWSMLPMLGSRLRERTWGYRKQTMKQIARLRAQVEQHRVHPAVFLGAGGAIAAIALFFSFYTLGTTVRYDGEVIAAVSSQADAEEARARLEDITTRTLGETYTIDDSLLQYSSGLLRRQDVVDSEVFEEDLSEEIGLVTPAYCLYIDGERIGATPYEGALDELLQQLQDAATNENTISCSFAEDVQIKQEYVPSSEIMNLGYLAETLYSTKTAEVTYTVVKGDTWSEIAEEHGLSSKELLALNPGYNIDKLQIGEVLTLSASVPYLTMTVVQRERYVDDVPFDIEYTNSANLYKGDYKVTSAGVYGAADVVANVTYVNGEEVERTVLSSVTLRDPVTEQRLQGTKERPTWLPTGTFRWPATGRITSRFGGRKSPGGVGSTNHKGIDIAGRYGTPIYAADGGTVAYAGWMSGYGYLVQINHGNGYVTYYGHNSSLLVSVGQHVYKGQQIAKMGSTGNSTGNHCHFEVRYNGVAKNPLNYLP